MVFKDNAGTMQAQIDHANQEKKVLYALQNINIASKGFDDIPKPVAKAPAPLMLDSEESDPEDVLQHFKYKPQDMHCLKKLLEQDCDKDYVPATYPYYMGALEDVLSAYMAGEYYQQLANEQIKKDLKAHLKTYITFNDVPQPGEESEQEEVDDNGSLTSSSDDEDSSEDEDALKPAPQIEINFI